MSPRKQKTVAKRQPLLAPDGQVFFQCDFCRRIYPNVEDRDAHSKGCMPEGTTPQRKRKRQKENSTPPEGQKQQPPARRSRRSLKEEVAVDINENEEPDEPEDERPPPEGRTLRTRPERPKVKEEDVDEGDDDEEEEEEEEDEEDDDESVDYVNGKGSKADAPGDKWKGTLSQEVRTFLDAINKDWLEEDEEAAAAEVPPEPPVVVIKSVQVIDKGPPKAKKGGVDPMMCRYCKIEFATPFDKLKHTREMHRSVKKMVPYDEVAKHFDNEDKMYCPICDKNVRTSNYKSVFVKHLLTHTEGVVHTCNVCQKQFRRKDHLRNHVIRHIVA